MGSSLQTNLICCNLNKNSYLEDVDLNKKSKDVINNCNDNINEINDKTINNENDISMIKKVQTRYTSSKSNTKKRKQMNREDSLSNKEPNISFYNNSFQILNNTQQFISSANIHLLKNNFMNPPNIRSFFNSKNTSVCNLSKLEENGVECKINTKLILTGDLFSNRVIEINKHGMKKSLRKKNDGVTVFGLVNNDNIMNRNLYDYAVNINIFKKDKKNKNYKPGKLFQIVLDKSEKIFMLYFLHRYMLLYYKINNEYFFEVDKEYYFIIGDIFMTVNIRKDSNTNEKILTITVEAENEKSKKYTFTNKDVPITIGRVNCTINILKPSISKLHSKIDILNDLFYYKDVKSTNGSTLLIKEDDVLKIKGEMNLKLEDASFKIKEITNDEK